ncbi:MAG: DNA replication/repair protein RecF [Ruminococcaceae bacterium]|nr:DNA replication/repair protein RecF [Oscillospiraceae bacterium]
MFCKKIEVRDFRNIESASVEFCDGVNILAGENAQGKTNLLEAIFYASVGRSFRAAHNAQLISFGEDSADISLDFKDSKRDQNIHMRIFQEKQRLAEKNGIRVEKLSDIMGSFRAVLFCPEHLSLIKDGPSERRAYLDMAISRMYPMYIHSLQKYNYALKQRNALLKTALSDRAAFEDTVDLWSEQLASEAAVISDMRIKFIRRAEAHISRFFCEMTGDGEIPTVKYHGSSSQPEDEYTDREKTKEKYMALLSSSHDREIYAGATLYGIHKDDIDILLNGKSARMYASQGQQRSLALSMKLAEGEICKEEFGDYPVFLFDDVLSELDGTRRDYLINRMKDKQVIITTCEPDMIKSDTDAKKIYVSGGKYTY